MDNRVDNYFQSFYRRYWENILRRNDMKEEYILAWQRDEKGEITCLKILDKRKITMQLRK